LSAEQREVLHAFAIQVSGSLQHEVPEMQLAAVVCSWLTGTVFPALAAFPEEARNGTTSEMKRNVKALVDLAEKVRPDAANPVIANMAMELQRTREAQAQATSRLVALGMDPAAGTPDGDKAIIQRAYNSGKASNKSVIIGLSVALAVLFLIAAVVAFMLFRRRGASSSVGGVSKSATAGTAAAGTAMAGGVSGGPGIAMGMGGFGAALGGGSRLGVPPASAGGFGMGLGSSMRSVAGGASEPWGFPVGQGSYM
jgi:hypothetical protein